MSAEKLRETFFKGETRPIQWRIDTLTKLDEMLDLYKDKIYEALDKDMKQTLFIKWNEIHSVKREIAYIQSNLHKWVQDEEIRVSNLTDDIFSTAKVISEPYGVVLIIGAWNYPFSLLLRPLVGAIAAGNVHVFLFLILEGDATVTKTLLAQKWDYIFFTGSIEVGRHIMRAAAENCTNLTLELGGKSPVIIDLDADLELAAKRVVFGKFVNCGQTCIAPDHVYVPKSIKSKFIDLMKKYIREFYDDAQNNPDYPRIINNRHFDRLNTILEAHKENVILGGETDKKDLYIAPTLLDNVKQDSPVMNEEIFGPILPILEYERVSELIPILRKVKPLVLYVFSDRDGAVEFFTSQTSSGCVTVNDCLTQYHVKKLPFGGVGESGFGKYHGKHSFDTFSHQKSFYQRPTIPFLDQKMRYPPHTKESLELAERLDINISYGWVALIMFPIAIYALSRYVKSPK